MTHEKMREMLSKDEKITIEYKECVNQIHDSVYETVSAFSNRYGGYIIMGVKDGGIPIGVNRNAVKDLKKNFVNQLNNPNPDKPEKFILYIPPLCYSKEKGGFPLCYLRINTLIKFTVSLPVMTA